MSPYDAFLADAVEAHMADEEEINEPDICDDEPEEASDYDLMRYCP